MHVFYDLNLRPGGWTEEVVASGLAAATIAKMSREELEVVLGLGLPGVDVADGPRGVLRAFGLDVLAVTGGAPPGPRGPCVACAGYKS